MKNIEVVAFDCDGVMFDTINANMAFYNKILEHFGRPVMTPQQLAYSHMHTADQSIAHLFPDTKSFEAAQTYRKQMSYLPFLSCMEMEPHLKPLIAKLKPRYKTAVATNRSDTMDRVITEHDLEGYFDLIVSACDVEHPKPDPAALIRIMEYFKIDSKQLIYIGDSQLDEMATKAADAVFVAYQNESLSAKFYISSLKEMENVLSVS